MPHYMFYAPGVTNADIGNTPDVSKDGPFVANAGAPVLGKGKAPSVYHCAVGATEKAKNEG